MPLGRLIVCSLVDLIRVQVPVHDGYVLQHAIVKSPLGQYTILCIVVQVLVSVLYWPILSRYFTNITGIQYSCRFSKIYEQSLANKTCFGLYSQTSKLA